MTVEKTVKTKTRILAGRDLSVAQVEFEWETGSTIVLAAHYCNAPAVLKRKDVEELGAALTQLAEAMPYEVDDA